MGCASSGPAKTASDSLMNFAKKEGEVVQEFGTATKDTILSGVNQVNEAVGSAFKSAENEVLSVTNKATNFFSHAENGIEDLGKDKLEHVKSDIQENMNEAMSDAETVTMSETEHVQNEIKRISSDHELEKQDLEMTTEDVRKFASDHFEIEDMEHFDHLGENIESTKKKVEKLIDESSSKEKEVAPTEDPKPEE